MEIRIAPHTTTSPHLGAQIDPLLIWDAIQCCREIHFSDPILHNSVLWGLSEKKYGRLNERWKRTVRLGCENSTVRFSLSLRFESVEIAAVKSHDTTE